MEHRLSKKIRSVSNIGIEKMGSVSKTWDRYRTSVLKTWDRYGTSVIENSGSVSNIFIKKFGKNWGVRKFKRLLA